MNPKVKELLVAIVQEKEQKRPRNTCFPSPSNPFLGHFKAPNGPKNTMRPPETCSCTFLQIFRQIGDEKFSSLVYP